MNQATLHAGQLTATVDAEGTFGWCGISRLEHEAYQKNWLLSPAFTLEHFIGIPPESPEYIDYEPCSSPTHLGDASSDRCTLYYAPNSCSQIAFSATYHLVAPHYIDVTMKMQTARRDWPLDHVALFFATIVGAPIYTGINLIGKDILSESKIKSDWIHFNSVAVESGKTAHPSNLVHPELPRRSNAPDTYYYSDSSIRFEFPLFCASIENMVFAVMFRPEDRQQIRFTVNPIAPAFGGPAWDFFWLVTAPQIDTEYQLSFRALFKPFSGYEDIRVEYERFIAD